MHSQFGGRRQQPNVAANSIAAWFRQATAYHQRGELNSAAELYQRILAQTPNHADALHLLGIIRGEQGKLDEALELINKAISHNPKFLSYYVNRSLVYRRLSKLDEAIADYRFILARYPAAFDMHVNLGDALFEQGRIDDAIAAFLQGLKINPSYLNGHHNLGNAYLAKKAYEQAIASYKNALAIKSDSIETLSNLGVALAALEKYDEAIACYQQALKIAPKYAQALANLGLALTALNRLDEAKKVYERAIAANPGFADSYSHLGILYKDQGQVTTAIEYFQKALVHKPKHPEFLFNLAISQLLLGDFAAGLEIYESRFNIKERQNIDYKLSQPVWQGEDLTGKKLFIWVEQGLGDTIQYLRFLRCLNKYSSLQVFLECQSELHELLQANMASLCPAVQLVPRRPPQFEFDYHIAIMSLARVFKFNIDNIPDQATYLQSVPNHPLQNLLSNIIVPNIKIGLNWQGSKLHKNDKNRSLALEDLKPLFNMGESNKPLRLYSIQYGATADEVAPFNSVLEDLSPHIKNLADTTAIINQLDLVITVDTAIAHLAGALGKPTWVLLPFAPDFRWLLNRNDSPWYKSIRLFRQSQSRSWSGVIEQIGAALVNEKIH